jgi:hypothetical protein
LAETVVHRHYNRQPPTHPGFGQTCFIVARARDEESMAELDAQFMAEAAAKIEED